MASEKRLAVLESMTASGKADSFGWYALALEYKGLGRHPEALATFAKLRERDPGYVAMYLMCGTMLAGLGRPLEAREWLESGIVAARAAANGHAASELEQALEALPPPQSLP
ncbi:MAG: tetratricopeptide repeat protein [Myxococcales bacterium]|nr:tetratricopeptide repeat protein [Myxococcales bacterium]